MTVTFQVLCRFSLHWRHIRLILFICTGYGNAVNCRESSAVCLVMNLLVMCGCCCDHVSVRR
jgi:hypothetical protein